MVVSRKFLCERCGLDASMHSEEDMMRGICTRVIRWVASEYKKPAEEIKTLANFESRIKNEESINAVEVALQSLLVVVRSFGLDPAQFLERALERENRETQNQISENTKRERIDRFREFGYRFLPNEISDYIYGDQNHRSPSGRQPIVTVRGINDGVTELRDQVETQDAIERSKRGKDSLPED